MAQSMQPDASDEGKRSHKRIKTRFPVVARTENGTVAQATTVNMSSSGLLLSLDEANAALLGLTPTDTPPSMPLSLVLFSPLQTPSKMLQPKQYRVVRVVAGTQGHLHVAVDRAGSGGAEGDTSFNLIDPADYQISSALESEFLKILEQMNLELSGASSRVIMLCGAESGAGVTSLAWWLAGCLGRLDGRQVLFADANLRPGLPKAVDDHIEGLLEVLLEKCPIEDAAVRLGQGMPCILNAGGEDGFTGQEITDERVKDAIGAMRAKYGYTIIDGLPPADSPLTLMLSRHCDGAFLVLASGETDQKLAREAMDQLRSSGTRVLGVLLNEQK